MQERCVFLKRTDAQPWFPVISIHNQVKTIIYFVFQPTGAVRRESFPWYLHNTHNSGGDRSTETSPKFWKEGLQHFFSVCRPPSFLTKPNYAVFKKRCVVHFSFFNFLQLYQIFFYIANSAKDSQIVLLIVLAPAIISIVYIVCRPPPFLFSKPNHWRPFCNISSPDIAMLMGMQSHLRPGQERVSTFWYCTGGHGRPQYS